MTSKKSNAIPGIDILWSIRPEALSALDAAMERFRSGAVDIEALAAADEDERDDYRLRDGVAIIPVTGVMRKRATFFGGAAGTVALAETVTAALEDPDVEALLLDIDSPGGTVSGTEAFSDIIYAARQQKPVVAFGNGQMCSAAYWAGSAADRVIVERTADVGSIGVLCLHADWSKFDERMGVKYTVLHAGEFKAVGSDVAPLSDRDRAVIQAELDTIYAIFIDTVARNRGVDAEAVRKDMADGRVFIGRTAVAAGLADAVGNFQDAMNVARELADAAETAQPRFYQPYSGALSPGKETPMDPKKNKAEGAPRTADELAAAFPELAEALRRQGAESINPDAIRTEGAQAEAERLLGLIGVHFGEAAAEKFQAIAATGITPDQYKATAGDTAPGLAHAIQEAAGIEAKKQEMLDAITAAGAPNPGSGAEAPGGDGKDFLALVEEYRAANKCGKAEALQAVIKSHPKAHAAYLKSVNAH